MGFGARVGLGAGSAVLLVGGTGAYIFTYAIFWGFLLVVLVHYCGGSFL